MNLTIGLSEDDAISLDAFTIEELELIAAFIFRTKLGANISAHRDAAYTLLAKLEDFFGEDHISDHVDNVNAHVEFFDMNRNLLISANLDDVEFDVR